MRQYDQAESEMLAWTLIVTLLIVAFGYALAGVV